MRMRGSGCRWHTPTTPSIYPDRHAFITHSRRVIDSGQARPALMLQSLGGAIGGRRCEADLLFRVGRYRNVLARGPLTAFSVPAGGVLPGGCCIVKLRSGPSSFDLVLRRYPGQVMLLCRRLVARSAFRSLCGDWRMLREMIAGPRVGGPAQQWPGTQSARPECDRLRGKAAHEIAREPAEPAGFRGSAPAMTDVQQRNGQT